MLCYSDFDAVHDLFPYSLAVMIPVLLSPRREDIEGAKRLMLLVKHRRLEQFGVISCINECRVATGDKPNSVQDSGFDSVRLDEFEQIEP